MSTQPDLLDALDAFEEGDDDKVRIYFQTEAERTAWAEGYNFAVQAAETARKQRDAVSLDEARKQTDDRAPLLDLLELALMALERDPVKSVKPGAFWRLGICERIRTLLAVERWR